MSRYKPVRVDRRGPAMREAQSVRAARWASVVGRMRLAFEQVYPTLKKTPVPWDAVAEGALRTAWSETRHADYYNASGAIGPLQLMRVARQDLLRLWNRSSNIRETLETSWPELHAVLVGARSQVAIREAVNDTTELAFGVSALAFFLHVKGYWRSHPGYSKFAHDRELLIGAIGVVWAGGHSLVRRFPKRSLSTEENIQGMWAAHRTRYPHEGGGDYYRKAFLPARRKWLEFYGTTGVELALGSGAAGAPSDRPVSLDGPSAGATASTPSTPEGTTRSAAVSLDGPAEGEWSLDS